MNWPYPLNKAHSLTQELLSRSYAPHPRCINGFPSGQDYSHQPALIAPRTLHPFPPFLFHSKAPWKSGLHPPPSLSLLPFLSQIYSNQGLSLAILSIKDTKFKSQWCVLILFMRWPISSLDMTDYSLLPGTNLKKKNPSLFLSPRMLHSPVPFTFTGCCFSAMLARSSSFSSPSDFWMLEWLRSQSSELCSSPPTFPDSLCWWHRFLSPVWISPEV